MAAAILSQDILAICLIFSEGNVNLSLEEIVYRVENFQESHDRHFGISRHDFRNLFYTLLILELGIKAFGDKINDVKLFDIICDIIKYQYVYFNDGGEYWIKYEKIDSCFIKIGFGYDEKKYHDKINIKQQIDIFFKNMNVNDLSPGIVKKFMEKIQLTDDILYICSRPGESS